MESVAVASERLALAKQSPISVRQPSDSPLHAIRLLAHGAEDADMGHLTSEQPISAAASSGRPRRTRTRTPWTPATSSDGSEHIPTASPESMGGSYSHHTPNPRIIRITSARYSPLLKAIEMGLREHAPTEGAG